MNLFYTLVALAIIIGLPAYFEATRPLFQPTTSWSMVVAKVTFVTSALTLAMMFTFDLWRRFSCHEDGDSRNTVSFSLQVFCIMTILTYVESIMAAVGGANQLNMIWVYVPMVAMAGTLVWTLRLSMRPSPILV